MGNFKPQNEELLEIVDENNQSLGIFKKRGDVHKDYQDWHRIVSVLIINAKGKILCQKQSPDKLESKNFLDKWMGSFGGHVIKGQDFLESAKRELEEEIGLLVNDDDLKFIEIRKSLSYQKHFCVTYILHWDGRSEDLKFNDGEIAEVKWFEFDELKKMKETGELATTISDNVAKHIEEFLSS